MKNLKNSNKLNGQEIVDTPAKEKKTKKKRKLKLDEEAEKLKNENLLLKDQLLRKMAEFENYRKRTQRDISQIINSASENVIIQMLPVIDDLERSLDQAPENKDDESFRTGIELIYVKLFKVLQDKGLKPMESDGREFDPEFHEALMQMENEGIPSQHIIQTFEKGYFLNKKVIRHAKVSVSK